MKRQKWECHMKSYERMRGWVFFLLYLLVFPYLNGLAQRFLMGGGEAPVAETNLIYYAFLFALALLVFWTFLREDLGQLLDWLPENLFGILTGLVGALALTFLVDRIPLPVTDPIPLQYALEFALSPLATAVLVILLIPLIEETLFRGLVFGSLRGSHRIIAYVVTVLLYALALVWRYALDSGDPAYLLLLVRYLPVSLALTWCYDCGGSIWGTILLHMALNGVALATAVS